MLSCLTTLFAVAQETATIDGIKYYLENGEATVMVQTNKFEGDLVIPETVTDNDVEYKVVRLAAEAFAGQEGITSITLPNSVIEIGERCFSSCYLTSITLPENITELADSCFYLCYYLKSITLPESITKLGISCFENCFRLESITLPESITELGMGCFSDCNSLESITLPESITKLGDECFVSLQQP